MRHARMGRRFDMPTSQRLHMFRTITQQVIRGGGVMTTQARAKEVQPMVDKMITLGKANTVHARRQAFTILADLDLVKHLFDEVAPKYAERPGGYTRVIKLGQRKGDASYVARLELV